MRTFQKIYLITFLTLLFLIASLTLTPLSFASLLDAKNKELKQLNAKIDLNKKRKQVALKREIDILREIESNDKVLSKLSIELQKLGAELAAAKKKRQQTEFSLMKTKKQLISAKIELDVAQRKLEYQQAKFNKRLKNIYKNGTFIKFEFIIASKDLGDLIARTEVLRKIAENDAKLVQQLTKSKTAVAKKVISIEKKKQKINKLYLVLAEEEARLKKINKQLCLKYELFHSEQKRQKKMFAMLQQEKAKINRDLDVLASTSKMVAEQIRILKRGGNIMTARAFARTSAGFIKPCDAPITSGYGWRFHPILHYSRLHSGIDFGAPTGTTIRAVQSGTVIIAGWMGGYGNAVVIDHGGNITTLYGHNSKLLVNVGDVVAQGQAVALSGSSGLSTGPHLHFEVRINGSPTNPSSWLN